MGNNILAAFSIFFLFGISVSKNAKADDLPNFASEFCKKIPGTLAGSKRLKGIAEASNSFGIALFKQISVNQKNDANIVYSPMSAHLLLAMVGDGAAGATKSEILTALKIRLKDHKTFASDHGDLIAQLTCPSKDSTLEFTIANGIFKQKSKPFQQLFVQSAKENFDSSPLDVDFSESPANACKEINAWVSQKTASKITNLVSEQSITNETKLILVNAVHLKDSWSTAFDKTKTKLKDFTSSDGKKSKVPTMFREGLEGDTSYASFDDFEAAGIETNSREIDLIVLLPKKKNGLQDLEKKIDSSMTQKIFSNLSNRVVHLNIPKFKISSDIALKEDLKALGIKKMFQPGIADFKPMDGGEDLLYAAAVLQKAVIEIHEKGIEAAAATAAIMGAGGMPPKPKAPVKFNADHPFLYLVRHKQTNAILIMGRIGRL